MQVQSLASLNDLSIQRCHELWCSLQTRLRSHLAVWLWCMLVATAPVGPLALAAPHAVGMALKKKTYVGIQLTYEAVFVSSVQQKESVIYTNTSILFQIFFPYIFPIYIYFYRTLTRVPCAVDY